MLTGKQDYKAGRRKMALLVILCIIFSAIPVFAASGADNMLTNPDWEYGTDGWVIQANNADGVFDGESIIYSRIYQDVPLSEPEGGQVLVLSADLQSDPSQINIEMGLIICKSDGSYITELADTESGYEWKYHELITAIPSEAGYARVCFTIRKNNEENMFGFSDLSLEMIRTADNSQQQSSGFVKTDNDTPAQDTDSEIQTPADNALPGEKISASYRCDGFILNDGSLWTLGTEYLGGGETAVYNGEPVHVTDNALSVSVSDSNGAVIKTDSTLWTWGRKSTGSLGFESSEDVLVPVQIAQNAVKVDMGQDHSAFIKDDGTLWIWGSNSKGQLGYRRFVDDQGLIESKEPKYLMDNVSDVSCSTGPNNGFTLVLKNDGTLWSFGDDSNGELGLGTTDLSQQVFYTYKDGGKAIDRPFRDKPCMIMEDVVRICAGIDNAAAIKSDGSLWVWGRNDAGQVGNGGAYNTVSDMNDGIECQTFPVKILDDVASVSLGPDHGAALKNDGSVWTWGSNGSGQIGNGKSGRTGTESESFYTVPQKAAISDVVQISAGDQHTVAVKSDGTIWAWGYYPHVISSDEPVQLFK